MKLQELLKGDLKTIWQKLQTKKAPAPVAKRHWKKEEEDLRYHRPGATLTNLPEEVSPEVLNLDLIKDEIPVIFDWRKNLYRLAGFILLALIMVGEVYFTLYSWEKEEIAKKSENLQSEIERLDRQIIELRSTSTEALKFKDHLDLTKKIFDNHVYWSNFFAFLEKNTLANIYYSSFRGDTKGSYSLSSFTNDYRAISLQLKTLLAESHVKDVAVENEKVDQGGNTTDVSVISQTPVGAKFDLRIIIKPELFNE